MLLTRPLPSPSPSPPTSRPATPTADQSSTNPHSPRPLPCFAVLQTRPPPSAPFQFRPPSVGMLRGSRESARDEHIPCLQIPPPARLLPNAAVLPGRRYRRRPSQSPALLRRAPHLPRATAHIATPALPRVSPHRDPPCNPPPPSSAPARFHVPSPRPMRPRSRPTIR